MRIIIISYGVLLEKLMSIINHDRVEIICVVIANVPFNNNCSVIYHNRTYHGISYEYVPELLANSVYDYICVAGEEETVIHHLRLFGVDPSKILNLKVLDGPYYDGFSRLLVQAEKTGQYEAFSVGISYTEVGCDLEVLPIPAINLAGSSQDLYFNYLMAKKIISLSPGGGLRYAILGIAPYSFHFDMSRSVESWVIFAYYPIFHDTHNYHLSKEEMEVLFNHRYTSLYENMRAQSSLSLIDVNDPFGYKAENNHGMNIKDKLNSRFIANVWSRKRYPETVKENKRILLNLVQLCRSNHITPIVVGFPFSPVWNMFFSQEILKEFYQILSAIQEEETFYFLDCFQMPELKEDDFYNADHVNSSGARKVSLKIASLISNLEENSGNV